MLPLLLLAIPFSPHYSHAFTSCLNLSARACRQHTPARSSRSVVLVAALFLAHSPYPLLEVPAALPSQAGQPACQWHPVGYDRGTQVWIPASQTPVPACLPSSPSPIVQVTEGGVQTSHILQVSCSSHFWCPAREVVWSRVDQAQVALDALPNPGLLGSRARFVLWTRLLSSTVSTAAITTEAHQNGIGAGEELGVERLTSQAGRKEPQTTARDLPGQANEVFPSGRSFRHIIVVPADSRPSPLRTPSCSLTPRCQPTVGFQVDKRELVGICSHRRTAGRRGRRRRRQQE